MKEKKKKLKVEREREEGEETDDEEKEEMEEESEYEEYSDFESDDGDAIQSETKASIDANAFAAEMFLTSSNADDVSVEKDESQKEEDEMLRSINEFRKLQTDRELTVASARQTSMRKRIHDEIIKMDYDQRRAIEMAPKIAEEEARRAKRAEERKKREEMEKIKNAAPVKVELKGMNRNEQEYH